MEGFQPNTKQTMQTFFVRSRLFALLALVGISVIVGACESSTNATTPAGPGTIAAVASADARFTTLVRALTRADLVTTVQGAGPFTVFAPTNDAFARLLTDLKLASIDDVPVATLKNILLYHVLGAKVAAADVKSGAATTAAAAPNNQIFLSKVGADVFINGGTKVIVADVAASNGVIHAIDRVLVPPTQNLVEIAVATPASFSSLVAAVTRAGVGSTLTSAGPFTVFAPTNAAFAQLLTDLKVASINDIPVATLQAVLLYHVVPGRVFSSDLTAGVVTTAKPTPPNSVTVAISPAVTVKASGNATASNVTSANILATNGVIHVIDRVLLP
jgi:uncharacterized surface protein with fasciclin (FAS1) repeats